MRVGITLTRRSGVAGTLLALLMTLAVVTPGLAYHERITGTVGPHSLRDSSSTPGVTCTYKEVADPSTTWAGKLRWIDVRPPRVRAITGTQAVGWRFLVQRVKGDQDYDNIILYGRWRTTYISAIQQATATTTTPASFTPMSITVSVPNATWQASPGYLYRVLVKMFWFHPDATIQGTAKDEVEWYREVWPGFDTGTGAQYCKDWYAW